MKKVLIILFLSLSGMAAYSQSQQAAEPVYDLKLTATEVNFLLQLVAEQPYKNVAQLMMKLQGQLAPQIQAGEKVKGKPEGAGKPEGTPKGKPEGAGKPEGTIKNEE